LTGKTYAQPEPDITSAVAARNAKAAFGANSLTQSIPCDIGSTRDPHTCESWNTSWLR